MMIDIPDKIYHATKERNILSIINNGLKPLGIDKLIYFCDTFAGAGTFAYIHGVPLDDIVIIEIDTTNLNKELFDYGRDHNPNFFKGIKVYTYPEEIPSEYISDYFEIDTEGE